MITARAPTRSFRTVLLFTLSREKRVGRDSIFFFLVLLVMWNFRSVKMKEQIEKRETYIESEQKRREKKNIKSNFYTLRCHLWVLEGALPCLRLNARQLRLLYTVLC